MTWRPARSAPRAAPRPPSSAAGRCPGSTRQVVPGVEHGRGPERQTPASVRSVEAPPCPRRARARWWRAGRGRTQSSACADGRRRSGCRRRRAGRAGWRASAESAARSRRPGSRAAPPWRRRPRPRPPRACSCSAPIASIPADR